MSMNSKIYIKPKPKVIVPVSSLLTTDGKGQNFKLYVLKSIIKRVQRRNKAEKALNWLVGQNFRISKYDDGFVVTNPKLGRHSTIAIGESPLKAILSAKARLKLIENKKDYAK